MKTKEAYQLNINGSKYYFSFDYAGWRKASEFVVNILKFAGNYPLKKVRVAIDKQLIG